MLKIGPYQLRNRVVVAPMAGVTDRPYRQLCKRLGAGYAVSEMAASNPALWKSVKTSRRLDHAGEIEPRSVQIAGADPAMMAEAARYNVDRGAQIIDINMGCPAKKVCNVQAGSALMANEALALAIISAVADAVNVPVTVKMRIGIDDDHKTFIEAGKTAAQLGVPLSLGSCERLAREMVDLPTPWPKTARAELVRLIGAGAAMVRVWEALEQEGVISRIFPEWNHLRSLPQRNVLHRHTVDRHMVETAVKAAALTRSVHRPDLLLIAALFHDLGKGFAERDHSDYGAELMAPLAVRLGFADDDVNILKIGRAHV